MSPAKEEEPPFFPRVAVSVRFQSGGSRGFSTRPSSFSPAGLGLLLLLIEVHRPALFALNPSMCWLTCALPCMFMVEAKSAASLYDVSFTT